MNKSDFTRVKALAAEGYFLIFNSVYRITRNGMADISHVNANLVSSARFQDAFNMSISFIPADNLVMSNRVFAIFLRDAHFFAVDGMSAYRSVNYSPVILQ